MIPFILHRLSYLTQIHDFSLKLNNEAGPFYNPTFEKIGRIDTKINFSKILSPKQDSEITINRIDINDLLNAFTLKGAGELFDMEQLEILGDSFLKYFVTIGLFCNKVCTLGVPAWNVFEGIDPSGLLLINLIPYMSFLRHLMLY